MKLPNYQGDKGNDESVSKEDDEVRSKPVLFLTLIQRDLQRSHGNDQQADADVVDAVEIVPVRLLEGRIFNQPVGEEQRQDADRNVDVEDPVPGVIVGDPSAQGWPDGGRQHRDQSVQGKCEAAL